MLPRQQHPALSALRPMQSLEPLILPSVCYYEAAGAPVLRWNGVGGCYCCWWCWCRCCRSLPKTSCVIKISENEEMHTVQVESVRLHNLLPGVRGLTRWV